MDIKGKLFWPALAFFFAAFVFSLPAFAAPAEEPFLVGRIAYIEGQVLRYVPDNKDWVATVKDAPFGINDALYSDQVGRGEFIMPNGVWTRIGGSTQIQLIALKYDICEMDVAAGVARFYNRSSNTTLKVTTPYGYVLSYPGSSFDLYVGDQSLEVIALDSEVSFIQLSNTKYEVTPGTGSIIADADRVIAGESTVDASWDDWNSSRDSLWSQRTQVKGDSISYLPPQLQDEAYDLEQNGKWEKVYYEGEYRTYWRPTHVQEDWRPFTVGRWTEWYGDQCWVPDEPFGYVTHHYGNWVIINGRWFWAPPVPPVAVVAGPPVVGFAWYPGRVAWISNGPYVGWVPLAPTEVYYTHRYWGPSAVVIGAAPVAAIAVGGLAFASAAVVVPQNQFWGVRDYSRVRVANIDRTVIINNYHAAPVVNNTIISNYSTAVNRYNFTPAPVAAKPHMEVVQRIERNQQLAVQRAPRITAAAVKQEATAARLTSALPPSQQQIKLPPPTVTNKIVPADKVAAPRNQVQFKPAEIKLQPKPAPTGTPLITGTPGKTGATPPIIPGATLPSSAKPPTTGFTQPPTSGPAGIPAPPSVLKPGAGAPLTTQPGTVTQPTLPGSISPQATPPGTTGTRPPSVGPSGIPSPGTTGTRPPTMGPPGIPSPRTQPPPPTLKTPAGQGTAQPTLPGTTGTQPPATGVYRNTFAPDSNANLEVSGPEDYSAHFARDRRHPAAYYRAVRNTAAIYGPTGDPAPYYRTFSDATTFYSSTGNTAPNHRTAGDPTSYNRAFGDATSLYRSTGDAASDNGAVRNSAALYSTGNAAPNHRTAGDPASNNRASGNPASYHCSAGKAANTDYSAEEKARRTGIRSGTVVRARKINQE